MSRFGYSRYLMQSLALLLVLVIAKIAAAQDPALPLKPQDRSSPRATLNAFLESMDETGAFLANDYLPAPSKEKFKRVYALGTQAMQTLDLSQIPPATQIKSGRLSAVSLYEVLSRLPPSSFEAAPDAEEMAKRSGADAKRWVIPDTEIALVQMESGARAGEFLFSADTVVRADEFYARIRELPYARQVPIENLHYALIHTGGWMLPHGLIRTLPTWLKEPVAGQPGWKWIGLGLLIVVYALILWLGLRISHGRQESNPLRKALAELALPAVLMAATPIFRHFALVQIYLIGGVANGITLATTAVLHIAGAWLSWRLAQVIAEVIIASPMITSEDTSQRNLSIPIIRLSTRLLGLIGSAALLAVGADRLGIPVYGIIAGLGVGGLAIALAAQPSVENFIGSLHLYVDQPIRVGEFFKYGNDSGTLVGIGMRSAKIRGLDRTLTSIPNAALAKMPIVNFSRRDKILVKCKIGLRFETTPDQLRKVLAGLREMLADHPHVDASSARARFVGFGESSLDIELFAYVMTSNWSEFLGIREDILLQVMDIIAQSGASLAHPSRMLYLGRDLKPDSTNASSAESQVRAWQEEGSLPFPDLSPEQGGGPKS